MAAKKSFVVVCQIDKYLFLEERLGYDCAQIGNFATVSSFSIILDLIYVAFREAICTLSHF